jgi:hypothetical protein
MKDINAELSEKLESFYSNETFYDGLLHETCNNAKECWEGLSEKVKAESKWNYFSLPYIGKSYKGELVCVGLNVHDGGGRNLQEMQIRGIETFKTDKEPHDNDIYGYKYNPGVIESFQTKRKPKVFFEKGMMEAVKRGDLKEPYGGTPFWHCIAVYSRILLAGDDSNVATNFDKLAEIFERIIYMDAIKCSPATTNSEPKGKMPLLCPKYIFFKELEIIRPDNILIMSHQAAELIRKAYKPIGGSEDFPGINRKIDYCQIKIGGKSVNAYYIIHPGSRIKLFQKFAEFLKSKRNSAL